MLSSKKLVSTVLNVHGKLQTFKKNISKGESGDSEGVQSEGVELRCSNDANGSVSNTEPFSSDIPSLPENSVPDPDITKDFVCGTCHKQMKTAHGFKVHSFSCNNVWPFACKKCGKGFSTNDARTRHVKTCGRNATYECKKCDKIFPKYFLLARHCSHEHRIKQYRYFCSYCPRKFTTKKRLVKHERFSCRKLAEHEFHCSHCSKCFHDKRKLVEHFKTNCAGGKRCKCCFQYCSSDDELEKHIDSKICAVGDSFICSTCFTGFVNEENFKTHNFTTCTSSKKARCIDCAMDFVSFVALKVHMGTHSKEMKTMINFCKKCNKGFLKKGACDDHMLLCGEYKCNECKVNFETKTQLTYHILYKCGTAKKFVCDKCQKAYKSYYELKAHVERNCYSKPFVCTGCGHGFSLKQSLKEHSLTKCRTIKPFLCNLCGKGYWKRSHLKAHIDTKCGTICQFQCCKCGKKYKQKSQLMIHEESNCGKIKLFKCENCQKGFSSMYSLRIHVASNCSIGS